MSKNESNIVLKSENILGCAYVDGIYNYFATNKISYRSTVDWNGPCASDLIYQFDPAGSIPSYRQLMSLAATKR